MTTTDSPDAVATVRGDEGASVLGPDNVAVALQNPGAPPTDSGSLPNLKFPFAAAHNRLQTGGWAREVTVRELPVRHHLGWGEHAAESRSIPRAALAQRS
jgi:oxalate decarboxylase